MEINKSGISLMRSPGIYAIVNTANGKRTAYIGSTSREFRIRLCGHESSLNRKKHRNPRLQREWNKYGENAFLFFVVEVVTNEIDLVAREQFWLDRFRVSGDVYNCGLNAERPSIGRIVSNETRDKISIRNLGRKDSETTKHKKSIAALGKPKPQSTSDKLREFHSSKYPSFKNVFTGMVIPPGTNFTKMCKSMGLSRLRMRIVRDVKRPQFKGWALETSNITKEEAIKLNKPKRNPFTDKHRKNMGLSHELPYPSFINENTGESISAGIGLSRMCQEKGLNTSCMHKVATGHSYSYKRWMLLDTDKRPPKPSGHVAPYPSFKNIITGEVIPPGCNLCELERKYGLEQDSMGLVARGKREEYKGWIINTHLGDLSPAEKSNFGLPKRYRNGVVV